MKEVKIKEIRNKEGLIVEVLFEGKIKELKEYIERLVSDELEVLLKENIITIGVLVDSDGEETKTNGLIINDVMEKVDEDTAWFCGFYLLHRTMLKNDEDDEVKASLTIEYSREEI